jgi:endoglucanase
MEDTLAVSSLPPTTSRPSGRPFASEFADNEKVIFDTNDEYHDMDQTLVLNLNQAAINGIRAAGATSQYIFVEGNAYSGAWSWTDNNDNLSGLTDSEDKIVYEMHQYLDSDSSGTSETCVSSTIGKERLESATTWLKNNNKKGIIGELAGGVNSDCETAVEGMLSYMSENSDVWMGASWWSAGPWWGTYMYSLEPTDGPAYSTYLPILEKYFVSGSSSSASASTTTSGSVEATATATPNSQVQVSSPPTESAITSASTSAASVEPISAPAFSPSFVSVYVPTSVPTTLASVQSPSPIVSAAPTCSPSASGGVAKHYYQCGGINWTVATSCESPYPASSKTSSITSVFK